MYEILKSFFFLILHLIEQENCGYRKSSKIFHIAERCRIYHFYLAYRRSSEKLLRGSLNAQIERISPRIRLSVWIPKQTFNNRSRQSRRKRHGTGRI